MLFITCVSKRRSAKLPQLINCIFRFDAVHFFWRISWGLCILHSCPFLLVKFRRVIVGTFILAIAPRRVIFKGWSQKCSSNFAYWKEWAYSWHNSMSSLTPFRHQNHYINKAFSFYLWKWTTVASEVRTMKKKGIFAFVVTQAFICHWQ